MIPGREAGRPSTLRVLARDYFEGRLDRDTYRRQRRVLIDAWVAGEEEPDHEYPVAQPGDTAEMPAVTVDATEELPEEHPDGSTLEHAFANRNREAERAGVTEFVSPDSLLIPDFSRPADESAAATGEIPPAGTVAKPGHRWWIWLVLGIAACTGLVLAVLGMY